MKLRYYAIGLLAVFAVAMTGPLQARAQGSELVVEWADANGDVIVNALRDAIANDTDRPADRVYVLKRGGFYWIEDRIQYDGFHLRIRGQTAEEADPEEAFVCGPAFNEDCGPAIIQRVRREDQSIDPVMIQNTGEGSHLTIRNVWLMGQDSDGITTAYEQIQLDATNARFVFDNVIFDRNDWHFLGPNASGVSMFVTNSVFRNIHGPSQQWEGLAVRFEVGADSVVFDNNTFLNIGFTPFQSEAAPMNYFRANHNTFVNIGRSFQAGALWKEAYITNNVFINPFWHGEQPSEYNDPDREDPYTGFFAISALPARFGTNFDREIVFANNSYWRDPALEAMYPDSIRMQPIVNDTTMGYFNAFENMVFTDNYIGERPDLVTYPADILDDMVANITQIRLGNSDSPTYRWDPGRDEECFVCNIWPLPENFSYTNQQLMAGGTDGLPLGDLNWFPEAKATYEANKAEFVAEIEAMAEGVTLESVLLTEAEDGVTNEQAAVEAFDGFASFFMQGSGYIEWTFTLEQAGTYGLNLHTNMRTETQRGQRILVDGTNLRNNSNFGEYYFCTAAQEGCPSPIPGQQWTTVEIRADGLIEGAEALTMEAGTHTVRIEPSWGWQGFSGVDIVDGGGNVVVQNRAIDARYEGVQAECEGAEYCPQGFRSVLLNAGGQVSWNVEAPYDGSYTVRVFYQASEGPVTGQVLVDDQVVLSGVTFDGEAGDPSGRDLFTESFTMAPGVRKITIATDQGGLRIDYIQVLAFGGSTATEPDELPAGYSLSQNYPNPFNPTTTIVYSLAEPGAVRLTIYDLLGREVRTLVDRDMPAGTFRVTWDGTGAEGSLVASGLYLYRLETAVGQQTRAMVFLK